MQMHLTTHLSVRLLAAAVVAALVTPVRAQDAPTVLGRYVHVTLVGKPRELHLAEVEVAEK